MENDQLGFKNGMPLEKNLLDPCNSWEDSLEVLESELLSAGVTHTWARSAAAFFLAAYFKSQPILLAGPAGTTIAHAICASLNGCTAGSLDASQPFHSGLLAEAEKSSDKVIVVYNLFAGNWLIPLTEQIQRTQKYYIFVHPFYEDLQIEPQSLFDYMLPILTGPFVENLLYNQPVGGYQTETYQKFESTQGEERYPLLQKLHMNLFARNRFSEVLSDAQQMTGQNNSQEIAYLFCYFPYAYITGQSDILLEKMAELKDGSKSISRIIMPFLEH